ncbi:MAG: O-antigen ligase family protein [Cyanobacteriota bacterium]
MLFLIKGLTSIELARGFLHAIRFLEAVTLYYIVVYFIRAKKLKISTLLKLLIITTIFQALLGPLQSIFNNFGVQEYANNRGYFGYLGLGPTMVYSGRGTFWHFAAYGYYIGTIFLFLLPFYRNIIKNKFVFNLVLICLFAGILFSYSRGALAALIIGVVYYLVVVEHKKTRLMLKLLLIGMIITPFALYFLSNQEYLLSLNPRNQLWGFHITYLLQNPGELIWGAGFESRESTFYIYAPKYLRHPGDFNPHNLLLTYLEEIGIVGCLIYLSFWIKVFIDSFKKIKNNSKFMRTFNIGIQLVLVNVFLSGINDHVYHDPYLTMFLIFLLGISYAKTNRSGEKHPI